MAKAYAHCATPDCTNTITFIERNRKTADRKAEWAESQGFICSECQEKQRQEENKKAAEQNELAGLPKLTGSEKQIAWAERIRAEKLEIISKAKTNQYDSMAFEAFFGTYNAIAIADTRLDYCIQLLKDQTSAAWWIDHRETKIGITLQKLYTQFPEPTPTTLEEQDIINDVKAEATVRPTNPNTETVAEISINENSVKVAFPEKREDFRLLMRKHGFSWMSDRWQRNLNNRAGKPSDRAAEIGHILLGSGFIIRIYDADIRHNAIIGKFDAEQTRWITLFTDSKDKGRLCIMWGIDESYYKAARRLPTSRYVKPYVSVAIEQYEQVLDFAEINNFSFSIAAQQAIEAAKAAKQAALIVAVEPQPKPKKRKEKTKPEPLPIPATVEISDELRD